MAASTMSLAMNCIELARGNSPLIRTRTKSEFLAVIGDPLCDLLLIGQAGIAAIHLAPDPSVPIAAKALPEAPVIAGWIPANQPQDFGLFIGKCPLGRLPDEIRNSAGLVKDHENIRSRRCPLSRWGWVLVWTTRCTSSA